MPGNQKPRKPSTIVQITEKEWHAKNLSSFICMVLLPNLWKRPVFFVWSRRPSATGQQFVAVSPRLDQLILHQGTADSLAIFQFVTKPLDWYITKYLGSYNTQTKKPRTICYLYKDKTDPKLLCISISWEDHLQTPLGAHIKLRGSTVLYFTKMFNLS